MSLILVAREEIDDQSLMHYRTKGSKNGQRLYQNPDGSLTALGRIHYGIGEARTPGTQADMNSYTDDFVDSVMKNERKIAKIDNKLERSTRPKKILKLMSKKEKLEDTNKMIRKSFEDLAETHAEDYDKVNKAVGIETNVTDARQRANERAEEAIAIAKQNKNEIREEMRRVRSMSDEDLQNAITRLNKEKQYSQLLQERQEREKGPIAAAASKLFQDAAMDLAKKSLGVAVDKLVDKAKSKTGIIIADYMNKDLTKLDSTKLKDVADAFNLMGNIATNKYKMEHEGRSPGGNDNGGGGDGGNNKGNNGGGNDSGVENPAGPNGTFSKKQKQKIIAAAKSGESAADIAKKYGASESMVREVAGDEFAKQSKKSETSGNETKSSGESKSSNDGSKDAKTSESKKESKPDSNSTFNVMKAIKQDSKAVDKWLKEQREQKAKMSEKERQQKLDDWNQWVNGTREDQIAERVRQAEQSKAEQEAEMKKKREAEARRQAALFGYKW